MRSNITYQPENDFLLSKATPGPQPGGEQTKISKIEFDPLGPSTMHVNTLRPGILVLSLFVWS